MALALTYSIAKSSFQPDLSNAALITAVFTCRRDLFALERLDFANLPKQRFAWSPGFLNYWWSRTPEMKGCSRASLTNMTYPIYYKLGLIILV
jgi:hypothetical protein